MRVPYYLEVPAEIKVRYSRHHANYPDSNSLQIMQIMKRQIV